MSERVDCPLLLVGSLPAESSEGALRRGAELFGDLVAALPDGETGARRGWVAYELMTLLADHPDIELVRPSSSPTGIPRHAYDVPIFHIHDRVAELKLDHWPRIDAAIESYETFRKLRDEGAIPEHVRFQVGLPGTVSITAAAFRSDFVADHPRFASAYEDLVAREIERLVASVPPADLAIQWDMACETLDIEGVFAWTPADGAWERFADSAARLAERVPEEALMGFHFCYGTLPEWPMYEARDLRVPVDMANAAIANAGRPVDWLHMPGPRQLRSEDDSYFAPLAGLDPRGARVFLGIILPLDGVEGLNMRAKTARRHLSDFGLAMYCGFGRQPGEDSDATMREHRETVLAADW